MIKETIITLLDIMTEDQAKIILDYIQETFELKQKSTWENIKEDIPTPDEEEIIKEYKNGNKDYQPETTHDQLLKELGIA